jgi:hypothetical protein
LVELPNFLPWIFPYFISLSLWCPGFADEGTSSSDRISSTTLRSTTDRFGNGDTTTPRNDQDGWNGQRTTDRFGETEPTERNGQDKWGSGNNGQRTTDRFGNFETTDGWNSNGRRTTDRFGNFETTQRSDQDSWNSNNGQRTTDRFGNFETTQRNNGEDSWNNNGQRTTDRFGNFGSSSTTTNRFSRTSTTTTDRYGDEYSDDHDSSHGSSHDHDDDSTNSNNNGWPNQDDRERNPIAGLRTTTTSTTTSRFTNRVPIPRDQYNSESGSQFTTMSFAVGIVSMAGQLVAYAVMK